MAGELPDVLVPSGERVPLDALIAALHNRSQPQGMGFLHARGDLTREDAAKLLSEHRGAVWSFDYFCGRPIKVVVRTDDARGAFIDEGSVRLYERDAGDGAFADAVRAAADMAVA